MTHAIIPFHCYAGVQEGYYVARRFEDPRGGGEYVEQLASVHIIGNCDRDKRGQLLLNQLYPAVWMGNDPDTGIPVYFICSCPSYQEPPYYWPYWALKVDRHYLCQQVGWRIDGTPIYMLPCKVPPSSQPIVCYDCGLYTTADLFLRIWHVTAPGNLSYNPYVGNLPMQARLLNGGFTRFRNVARGLWEGEYAPYNLRFRAWTTRATGGSTLPCPGDEISLCALMVEVLCENFPRSEPDTIELYPSMAGQRLQFTGSFECEETQCEDCGRHGQTPDENLSGTYRGWWKYDYTISLESHCGSIVGVHNWLLFEMPLFPLDIGRYAGETMCLFCPDISTVNTVLHATVQSTDFPNAAGVYTLQPLCGGIWQGSRVGGDGRVYYCLWEAFFDPFSYLNNNFRLHSGLGHVSDDFQAEARLTGDLQRDYEFCEHPTGCRFVPFPPPPGQPHCERTDGLGFFGCISCNPLYSRFCVTGAEGVYPNYRYGCLTVELSL